MIKNTSNGYGWVSIVVHWVCAFTVYGLFGLGLYMVDLSYADQWYHQAPHWHESAGILFMLLLLLRIIWRQINLKPQPIAATSLQTALAKWAHHLLYLLMLAIPISGYLISTADGHSVAVFDWFEIPSITGKVNNMETLSGQIHYWLSITIVGLSVGHIAAALKHHWFDKDNTLKRMFSPAR